MPFITATGEVTRVWSMFCVVRVQALRVVSGSGACTRDLAPDLLDLSASGLRARLNCGTSPSESPALLRTSIFQTFYDDDSKSSLTTTFKSNKMVPILPQIPAKPKLTFTTRHQQLVARSKRRSGPRERVCSVPHQPNTLKLHSFGFHIPC